MAACALRVTSCIRESCQNQILFSTNQKFSNSSGRPLRRKLFTNALRAMKSLDHRLSQKLNRAVFLSFPSITSFDEHAFEQAHWCWNP